MPEGGVTKRSRIFKPKKIIVPGQQHITYTNGAVSASSVSHAPLPYDLSGKQVTVSEGHRWPPPKGSLADIGGDFTTWKAYCVKGPPSGTVRKYTLWNPVNPRIEFVDTYQGPLLPVDPATLVTPEFALTSDDDLDELGATAIARCKPDNSVANLATALGELHKDGLPHLGSSQTWQSASKSAREAGEDYLNVQFGWNPLVRDVSDFVSGIRNYRSVLEQYERDAGRVVRRDYYFPLVKSHTEDILLNAPLYGPAGGTDLLGQGTLVTRTETRVARWFKGAFTYYLPTGYDSRKAIDRYALLADRLGLQFTPETLWNLAPWSWAVDWFSNTGDVISNVSSFSNDGLVMRYGYMMEETTIIKSYTLTGITYPRGASGPGATSIVYAFQAKRRRKANPYGFGVQWSGLSPFQTSILTALGITRSVK